MTKKSRHLPHYGWVIVFASFVIKCFATCIVVNCVSLFVKPVSEGLGITRQAFSLTTSFYSASGMIMALFIGRLFKRYDIKSVMCVSSVLLPLVYACYAIAPNIYVFYVIAFASGLMHMATTMVPISTLITRWFNKSRGLALGLAFTGTGAGGIFLNPFTNALISSVGWRKTYLVLAALMFVTIVPCTFLLIKNRPEDKGLAPYGGYPNEKEGAQAGGMTAKQALRSPLFWMLVPIVMVVTAGCSSLMQQTVSYVSDLGYTMAYAAAIGSLLMGCLAVGKIILGRLYDILGARRASLLSLGCLLATYVLLLGAGNKLMLITAIVCAGLGISFSSVSYPVLTQDLFGQRNYADLYGYVTLASNLGMVFGSPLTAGIFDKTGSYKGAWLGFAVLVACLVVLLWLLYALKAKKDAKALQPAE